MPSTSVLHVTPICWVANSNDLEAVLKDVDSTRDLRQLPSAQITPFRAARTTRNIEVVKFLVENGTGEAYKAT